MKAVWEDEVTSLAGDKGSPGYGNNGIQRVSGMADKSRDIRMYFVFRLDDECAKQ
jgi:hypothetical protein